MNGQLDPFLRCQKMTVHYDGREDFVSQMTKLGTTRKGANKMWDEMLRSDVWRNSTYTVIIDRQCHHGFGDGVKVVYLSIKRNDREAIHDWRDLMRIKAMLLGPDYEAIELYPAESRALDAANQYHLFAFTNAEGGPLMIPIGFTSPRAVVDDKDARGTVIGAKQRPLADGLT